jgi:hypothetical protein
VNTANFNVSETTPIGWCSAPALKVGDVMYMNGEKIVIPETGSYLPPADRGWYDASQPECTCPASDMLKDGWKCNCGLALSGGVKPDAVPNTKIIREYGGCGVPEYHGPICGCALCVVATASQNR